MNRTLITACWIATACIAAFLRFDDLAARPFHADEATGAHITARRMERGGPTFDPTHYHGPLLADLAIPLCRARGENSWQEMTKQTLRLVPAIAGCLLVLLPLAGVRRFGHAPMLAAAAFLATSPLLVYYSRMFIHEPLLVFCGTAALFAMTCNRGLIAAGALIGLMFAAKASFAISLIAWTGAAALLWWRSRRTIGPAAARALAAPACAGIAAFILTAGLLYTGGLRHPQGALDALRTFFIYQTVGGHDKDPGWYLRLLLVPREAAGIWWYGTPPALLATWAAARAFRSNAPATASTTFTRFLALSATGHFLIYSLIAYKTPWLACLPWAHVCLLAGFAANDVLKCSATTRAALAAVICLSLLGQIRQSRAATGRLASDERNPFAYVPTRPDLESLATWLAKLRATYPAGTPDTAAIIGSDYWPLPWYLRDMRKTGYWRDAPDSLAEFPLVFVMPEARQAVADSLGTGHVALPRGLRAGVPLHLFVRNDVWEAWMRSGNP
jgi:uncharacterized protein (TIGR03663 family)